MKFQKRLVKTDRLSMPEYDICRVSLANGHEAVAYALRESEDFPGRSIIKVIHNETKKVVQEIRPNRDLEVRTMCSITRKGLLAVLQEDNNEIFIYQPMDNILITTLISPKSPHTLLMVSDSLVVSAGGHLYFYDLDTFEKKKTISEGRKTIKLGDALNAIVASDNYIICDVWKKETLTSQVKMYDNDGNYIRDLGEPRIKPAIRSCFLGFLGENTIFVAFPDKHKCDISIYKINNGNKLNFITFENHSQLYICSLPKGGIAITQKNDRQHFINIINNPLEDKKSSLFDTTDRFIDSLDDMSSFVSQREKIKLPPLINGITSALMNLSIFPKVIDKIITEYSIDNQALDDNEVKKFFRN